MLKPLQKTILSNDEQLKLLRNSIFEELQTTHIGNTPLVSAMKMDSPLQLQRNITFCQGELRKPDNIDSAVLRSKGANTEPAKLRDTDDEESVADTSKKKAFVSYSWRFRKDDVWRMADDCLKRQPDFNVSIDRVEFHGDLQDRTKTVVGNHDIIIVFLSNEYLRDGSKSRLELDYAVEIKKPVFFVQMEPIIFVKMPPKLQELTGNLAHVKYHSDEMYFAEDGAEICKHIRIVLGIPLPKNRFFPVDVPSFESGYFHRKDEENRVLTHLVMASNEPGKGILVVTGEHAAGKTSLVSELFSQQKTIPGLFRPIYVFWISSSQWPSTRPFDEDAKTVFRENVIQLAYRADPDLKAQHSLKKYTTLRDIHKYFLEKHGARILFVLDDLTNVDVVKYLSREITKDDLICCAITCDPKIVTMEVTIQVRRPIENIKALNEADVRSYLESGMQLPPDQLGTKEIDELVKMCDGILLTASLIAVRFERLKLGWDSEYEALMEERRNRAAQETRFDNVDMVFLNNFSELDSKQRNCFYCFLLFEPSIRLSDDALKTLWNFTSPGSSLQQLLDAFASRAIVRVDKLDGTTFLSVHHYIWQAAMKKALNDLHIPGINEEEQHQALLLCLVSGSNSDMLLFEVVRQCQRRLLKQLLTQLSLDSLKSVCLQQNQEHVSFIMFLYNFVWPDDVQNSPDGYGFEKFGLNNSYRLILWIFSRMKDAGRYDCMQEIVFAQDRSLLLAVFNDQANNTSHYYERSNLVAVLQRWQSVYDNAVFKQFFFDCQKPSDFIKACVNGDLALAKKHFVQSDAGKGMRFAARFGHMNVVQFLAEKSPNSVWADQSPGGGTPLWFAARSGHLEIVQFFAEKHPATIGTVYEEDGTSPLWVAAQNGNIEVVKFLAQKHHPSIATKDLKNGRCPLWIASQNGHEDVARFLAEKDYPPGYVFESTNGTSPLSIAAQYGHMSIVTYLAGKYPETVGQHNLEGTTPVFMAAQNGNLEAVRFLAEQDPDSVGCPDNNGMTPVYIASQQGHFDVVHYIVDQCPVSVLTKTNDGATAIWCAVVNRHIDIVRFLDNEQPKLAENTIANGTSPLWIAAKRGDREMARYLAEKHPALMLAPAHNGIFPHEIAAKYGYMDISDFLVAELEWNGVIFCPVDPTPFLRETAAGLFSNNEMMEEPMVEAWPNGEVPYELDMESFARHKGMVSRIERAVEEMNKLTVAKFVPKSSCKETGDYLAFQYHRSKSESYVGRRGGRQVIHVTHKSNSCNILHEMFHVLGFSHEPQLWDSPSYVFPGTPQNGMANFGYQPEDIVPFGQYDRDSVMHYPCGNATLRVPNPGEDETPGQRKGLSESDVRAVNYLYGPPCCTFDMFGEEDYPEFFRRCATCWGNDTTYSVCFYCAFMHHMGHKLITVPRRDARRMTFVCDCGRDEHRVQICSRQSKSARERKQPMYICLTCFDVGRYRRKHGGEKPGICYTCANKCHAGHDLQFFGIVDHFFCACGRRPSQTKCKAK